MGDDLASMTSDHRLLVADAGNELLGLAMSGPSRGDDPPRDRELPAIYARGEARGSGIAHAVLDGVLGDEPAFLWVLDRNPRATAFSARNGLVVDGMTMTLTEFESNRELRMAR